jgi:hypothetical protein
MGIKVTNIAGMSNSELDAFIDGAERPDLLGMAFAERKRRIDTALRRMAAGDGSSSIFGTVRTEARDLMVGDCITSLGRAAPIAEVKHRWSRVIIRTEGAPEFDADPRQGFFVLRAEG